MSTQCTRETSAPQPNTFSLRNNLEDAGSACGSFQLESAHAQLQVATSQLLQRLIHLLNAPCMRSATTALQPSSPAWTRCMLPEQLRNSSAASATAQRH